MELIDLLMRLRSAELDLINTKFEYIVECVLNANDDDPRWGRLEVHDNDKDHPVWMTLGQSDEQSDEKQIYSYPIDHDFSAEDLQGFNHFVHWWHKTVKELSADEVIDDLLNDGSRLALYATLESLQSAVHSSHRPLEPYMVIDSEKGDWGVGLRDRHTNQPCLIFWHDNNELWIDIEFEYPEDPIDMIPDMQASFIHFQQKAAHDQHRGWV